MRQEIDQFECKHIDGRIETILEFQNVIQFSPLNGHGRRLEGNIELETELGDPVSYIDGIRYELVDTGEIVTRI